VFDNEAGEEGVAAPAMLRRERDMLDAVATAELDARDVDRACSGGDGDKVRAIGLYFGEAL
jgi:hypothetical protein